MNENYILELIGVEKEYGNFVLNNLNFYLPKGYIMGLVGPNGSGKTTTIKMILDLVKPKSGEIFLFGRQNTKYRTDILCKIGIVFDSHCFNEEWRPKDISRIYSWFYSKWDDNKFRKLLRAFDIGDGKMVKEMSKGMQMKLMIACALSYDAKLLILDEPTSGLDPVARDELIDILGKYVEDGEHSVLFSTHITEDLEKIADYITYIFKGKLLYFGEKQRFIEKYIKIKGSFSELDEKMKKQIIGLRCYEQSFEGLVEADKIGLFDVFNKETVTIEDIIVFMGRKENERNFECY